MAWSRPSARAFSILSAVRAVPMTVAPIAVAICSAIVATPEPTAWTSTVQPGRRPPSVTSASWAVMPASGSGRGLRERHAVRDAEQHERVGDHVLGLGLAGGDGHDPVADLPPRHARRPSAATSPANSSPGTSSR